MSFILDALKKSESDRQRRSAPGLADVPDGARQRGPSRWVWVVAALLAINAVVLLALWLRPSDEVMVAGPESAAEPAGGDAPSFSRLVSEARDNQAADDRPSHAERRDPAADPPAARAELPASREAEVGENAAPVGTPALSTFDELRASGKLQLPDLHLDIHVYGDKPADRFVFVNMNKYREQGRLAEGPLVKEISTDGVILEHQGTEFLLPRK